jgi:hypothetical protein
MVELTVYFDDPFWVAVLERRDGAEVRAARLVFGAEPTDAELYQLLVRRGGRLLTDTAAAAPVPAGPPPVRHRNPKRLAREAARQAAEPRPSTAAQQALSRSQHERAAAADRDRRAERDADAQRRYELRRAKAKRRHRGH